MLPSGPAGPESAREAGAAPGPASRLEPFEVFRQEREGDPMRHGGSVIAPDPTLASHYARELYSRRGESLRLWVVRRADILELDDPDLLNPPLDRSYKKPGGFVMRDKLAQARARTGLAKPSASSGGPARVDPDPDQP
jgi:ring-1,2-phenylacetyl-CoA epoxidase subunit PaaB